MILPWIVNGEIAERIEEAHYTAQHSSFRWPPFSTEILQMILTVLRAEREFVLFGIPHKAKHAFVRNRFVFGDVNSGNWFLLAEALEYFRRI